MTEWMDPECCGQWHKVQLEASHQRYILLPGLILFGSINDLDDVTEYTFGNFTYYTKLGRADTPDDVLPSRATWTGWGIDQRGIT